MELTQSYLKTQIHYDEKTGHITWACHKVGRKPDGLAGCIRFDKRRVIRINNKLYLASRLAFLYMTGHWPKHNIDHINGNSADDSWDNLRDVEQEFNVRNQIKSTTNTSGITGVYWSKKRKKWLAAITVYGKQRYIGCFEDINTARDARKNAEKELGFHANHGRIL